MTTTTQTAVKEKPIIFSGPMVKAILEGRKTQTRRVIKPQPTGAHCCVLTSKGHALFFRGTTPESPSCDEAIPKCPYHAGQKMWVRESFALSIVYEKDSGNEGQLPDTLQGTSIWYKAGGGKHFQSAIPGRWRPSIFMPRWASRITLEVTGVRVERVRDITEQDVIAEGFEWLAYAGDDYKDNGYGFDPTEFTSVWNKLNYARGYGWAKNPWVWVIEFKRVD